MINIFFYKKQSNFLANLKQMRTKKGLQNFDKYIQLFNITYLY